MSFINRPTAIDILSNDGRLLKRTLSLGRLFERVLLFDGLLFRGIEISVFMYGPCGGTDDYTINLNQ